jgi:glycosyltransferase involved in cell wall biosynthesis
MRSTVQGEGAGPGGHVCGPRPLRIGLIAPPWLPVPPTEYGGTEVVVDHLARGLVAVECGVVLFTTGDATCPVERRWMYPHALGTTADAAAEDAHVAQAYAELAGTVDVVHDHTLAGPVWATRHRPDLAVVTTAHGPFTPQLAELYGSLASHVAVIAISHAQRRSAPSVPVARVIHHGLDVEAYPMGRGDGGYVAFLGRMSPDKGVHRAIAIARAAGRRILIAAKMWEPAERRYFSQVVAPLLGDDAVYVGEVGGQRKLELLGGAEALVNPIQWPEPFGLVMIEALACGTPVLTFPAGAAPEIVEHGISGFLCRDEADMAARLDDVARLDRRRCRARVVDHFSTGRMVRDHLELYRQVLSETLPVAGAPTAPGPLRSHAGEAVRAAS